MVKEAFIGGRLNVKSEPFCLILCPPQPAIDLEESGCADVADQNRLPSLDDSFKKDQRMMLNIESIVAK